MILIMEERSVSCLVCGQTAWRDRLCELCHLAKERLNQHYKFWNTAYGGLSYQDYLRVLVRLPETGETIGALAWLILHDKGEADVKDTNHL